ncbi:MAG: PEP-utilizing enzyme [Candidatus Edwardsbacteria bacterium]|nr:PEP-utilizing enzyme [Candidatus Edwardsbacteria bacterium]
MTPYVRRLADIGPDQRALVGGKAAGLAWLIGRHFAVPDGFCITAEAYREYAEDCGADAAAMPPPRIRELLAGGVVPASIQDQVLTAYWELVGSYGGDIGVAVRSSAVGEDRSGSSSAGQYDTVLGVRGPEDLLAAVRRCWAGLWSERAVAYRAAAGLPAAAMAVVVQAMVEPESAGVVVTCGPGGGNELLVNAVWGLGEALAAGRVSPDEYAIGREPLQVRVARVAPKTRMTVPARPGVLDVLVPSAKIRRPVLNDAQLRELARIALTIERLAEGPRDIEWAYRDGLFHILQARPVTGAPRETPAVTWGDPVNRELARTQTVFWCDWNTRENMAYPLKPMAWSFFNDILVPEIMTVLYGIGPGSPLEHYCHFIDLVNGRAYWNMTLLAGHPFSRATVMKLLGRLDMEAHRAFSALAAAGEFVPARLPIVRRSLFLPFLRNALTFLSFPWLASPAWIARRTRRFCARADEYVGLDLSALSTMEMFAQARRYGRVIAAFAFPLLVVASKSLAGIAVIERLIRRWPELRVDDLLAGIPGNKTTETALELYKLSQAPHQVREIFRDADIADIGQVRELDAALERTEAGRAYLRRIAGFLAEYGHRGMKDLDAGHPSWREDPTYVYRMIMSYMALGPDDPDPLRQFELAAQKRVRLEQEIERRLSASLPDRVLPLRRWLFRWARRLVHDFLPWRENEKFYGIKVFPGSRRIILEAGRRYAAAGLIDAADDIFFLTIPEVEERERAPGRAPDEIKRLVRERRAAWERQVGMAAPFIVRSDGKPWRPAEAGDGGAVLRGVAASSGVATGIARIVREPAEAGRFVPGEILVAPYAEPGWAPLFLLARAVVMEVGGSLCHGAIVAREYGIPAVVGVTGATGRIRDGDVITVDGDRGEVRPAHAGHGGADSTTEVKE